MDKHRCKLCLRSFENGRALGGHMRSHLMNLCSKKVEEEEEEEEEEKLGNNGEDIESSFSEDEEGEEKELFGYGLRENPKKSIRVVDPEFSFVGSTSVVLQDRESETESSKNPIRRRSERIRKSGKIEPFWAPEAEPEPASSISDPSPEEDVAYCLMMLSRDNKWMLGPREVESGELRRAKARVKGKYKCETCFKVFRSYQALGGHRASHRKARINGNINATVQTQQQSKEENNGVQIHECPVCFRVFSSGQALGGHKRSHVIGSSSTVTNFPGKQTATFGESLIDLNLPAPIEDDNLSQIDLSAVSDAEFVNPIKHFPRK